MAIDVYDSGNKGDNFTVNIPDNAININIWVAGGKGGSGGSDQNGSGGGSGKGKQGRFQIPDYSNVTLLCRPGKAGSNGGSCFGSGGGGGSSSAGGGGGGGNATGCSGSGGGGGGASGVYLRVNGINIGWVICAGGGGGGGGGSWNRNGSGGSNAGGFSGGGTFNIDGGDGGSGGSCGDGAGGGGGGGGSGKGGGGGGGCDNSSGGGGGGGGGSRYASNLNISSVSSGDNDGDGYVRVRYVAVTPEINLFKATPAEQYSTDATPHYDTQLQWTVQDADSRVITSSAGEEWDVTDYTESVLDITNLPQSDAEVTSPEEISYTLTACYQSYCVSETIVVKVKNDNISSNDWNTQFSNIEPGIQDTYFLGTLSGVDMPTNMTVSGTGNFLGKSVGGQFLSDVNFDDGDNVYLKTTSLPFNTDLTGVESDDVFGNTNTKTVTVTRPGDDLTISIITRAPKIQETFDYSNAINKYPYEDIDLITNNPLEYTASAVLEMDDIEIDMEIKMDDPNAQVSINSGNWQNVREI